MPGSSLWLVPPPGHPLQEIISKLIAETLPSRIQNDGPPFAPHMTLTSGISPSIYKDDPQRWLDSIPWPDQHEVKLSFQTVKTEDVFFRRCYMKVAFDGVKQIAGIARAHGVEGEDSNGSKTTAWLEKWKDEFGPHVSLIYGNQPIDEVGLAEVSRIVENAGVQLGRPDEAVQGLNGWEGGVVWLVPTDKPIAEWVPISTRQL